MTQNQGEFCVPLHPYFIGTLSISHTELSIQGRTVNYYLLSYDRTIEHITATFSANYFSMMSFVHLLFTETRKKKRKQHHVRVHQSLKCET